MHICRIILNLKEQLILKKKKNNLVKLCCYVDGRSQIESQLAVSMEINGILYHGILFAQSNRSRLS